MRTLTLTHEWGTQKGKYVFALRTKPNIILRR